MPITMMIAEFLCNVRNGQGGFKQPYTGHPWVHHISLILRSNVKKKKFKLILRQLSVAKNREAKSGEMCVGNCG